MLLLLQLLFNGVDRPDDDDVFVGVELTLFMVVNGDSSGNLLYSRCFQSVLKKENSRNSS